MTSVTMAQEQGKATSWSSLTLSSSTSISASPSMSRRDSAISLNKDPTFPSTLRGKRVLLATESFGPVNGVSRTTQSLVTYLRLHGVNIVVVAPRFRDQVVNGQINGSEIRIDGVPLPQSPDLTVAYPVRLDRLYHRAFPNQPRPDAIYLASPASIGFQLLFQARQMIAVQEIYTGPPILLNFQTDLSAYSTAMFKNATIRNYAQFLLARVQGFLFNHSAVHTIFYPCTAVRDYLHNHTHAPLDRCIALGRGVDTILFHPSRRDDAWRAQIAPNKEPIVLLVGRLAPEKGLDFLADAAHLLLLRGRTKFKLVVVGGNNNPAVEGAIHARFNAMQDHVTFLGVQTGVQLATIYASSDVFAMVSITETFGLVVLEAMASGLPVVARAQGGPVDILDHEKTGYLVPPDDLDGYVARLEALLLNQSARHVMGSEARREAETKTWERINRRVAQQLALAIDDAPKILDSGVQTTLLSRVMLEMRLLLAMGIICVMWIVAVFPLLLLGHSTRGIRRRGNVKSIGV